MKLAHLTFALAFATTAAACTPERTLAPRQAGSSTVSSVAPGVTQVPLLFVVDGVRLQRDQVPSLTKDQIAAIHVVKGHAALKRYGPDGSYGVVEITTRVAATPRS